jgi:hypothetical protein
VSTNLIQQASLNIEDILKYSVKLEPKNKVLIISDYDFELTNILSQAYKNALQKFENSVSFYNFKEISTEGNDRVIKLFDELSEGDLVVLIQSGSFRLNDFRIRIYLFSKKLKVIEHLHLYRNSPEVFDVYINSLNYDEEERNWYQSMKNKLIYGLSEATKISLKTSKSLLEVGPVEIPKINIGDFTGMQNIGGTYPIGEVFTEAKDFESMNGSIYIYGFADREFNIKFFDPFRVDIQNGLIAGYGANAPKDFIDVLEFVKMTERPLIREIGFGLNRAITKERPLGDITAYERIQGIHLSLGEKHSVYKKKGITAAKARFHVDLFLCVDEISLQIGGESVDLSTEFAQKFS